MNKKQNKINYNKNNYKFQLINSKITIMKLQKSKNNCLKTAQKKLKSLSKLKIN